jgi:hypothetical protein
MAVHSAVELWRRNRVRRGVYVYEDHPNDPCISHTKGKEVRTRHLLLSTEPHLDTYPVQSYLAVDTRSYPKFTH